MAGLFDSIADLLRTGEHPKDVTKAYWEMNQQLQDEEGKKWNEAVQSLPGNYMTQDQDPTQMGPEGQAPAYQEPSALDRWKSQVDAMIQSSNPVLQKEGLSELAAYHARATSPESDTRTTAEKLADAMGLTGKKKTDFIMQYAMKSGQTINLGSKYPKSSDTFIDENGNPYLPTVDEDLESMGKKGIRYGREPTAEEAARSGAVTAANDSIDRITQNMSDKNVDLSGWRGLVKEYRTRGEWGSVIVDSILASVGSNPSQSEIEQISLVAGLSNQMLHASRGAQVGPLEQIMFNRQLPMPGQPKALFEENLKRSKRNLKIMASVSGQKRGFIGSPDFHTMLAEDPGALEEYESYRQNHPDENLPPIEDILSGKVTSSAGSPSAAYQPLSGEHYTPKPGELPEQPDMPPGAVRPVGR